MKLFRLIVLGASFAVLAACAGPSKFRSYDGPEVTRVFVYKGARRMYLMHGDEVLKSYRIGLGFAPVGHKQFEGDGKTPEGNYVIDRRNPNSAFHLSLGISYPNEQDVAYAESMGQEPGGDIFIHGKPNKRRMTEKDWTVGCVSLTNRQMEDVYAMVPNGTPITLRP